MKVKKFLLVLGILFCLINFGIVSAGFKLGEPDYEVESEYLFYENLKGWVNISFKNISINSNLTAYEHKRKVVDILNDFAIDYVCYPENCPNNSTISTEYFKLDIEDLKWSVPQKTGSSTFKLSLDDSKIFSESIDISDKEAIVSVIPTETVTLVDINFKAITNTNYPIESYTWDFGDTTTKITTKNFSANHSYKQAGIYNLTLEIITKSGNVSKNYSKKFEINVSLPVAYLNISINNAINKTKIIEAQISKLPLWVQTELKKEIDISNISLRLNRLSGLYKTAKYEKDYVEILNALNQIEVPLYFVVNNKIASAKIIPDPKELNLNALSDLGEEIDDNEVYQKSILALVREELDIKVSSEKYTLHYPGKTKDIADFIKISISPVSRDYDSKTYIVVNLEEDNVKFKEDYGFKKLDNSVGSVFESIGELKEIELLSFVSLDIGEFPFFISPELKGIANMPVCNKNGICEEEAGETKENCIEDCRSRIIPWLLILGLIILAFIVYIIMQEWYKRYYESVLFKDKNQLYNLINFMYISTEQGLKKEEIFSQLKKASWSSEKIEYAWRKLNGKRTGMWEIPIFNFLETKKINKYAKNKGK
ncbi:MAG: PKD domain-containing protein [Candidatus Nanoarchaeia archaeon]